MSSLRPVPGLLAALGLVLSVASSAAADNAPVPNSLITATLDHAIDWVYQQQNPFGNWEIGETPAGTQRDLADQGQFGFKTALVLRTLLAAGESEHDLRLQKAIDFLIINDHIAGVYAVGMRAQVWPLMTLTPAIRQVMARDRATLLNAMHTQGRTRGLYSFRTDFLSELDYADHSVSFYGTMGLKSLSDAGMEVPAETWNTIERAWRSQQMKDGSWVFQIGTTAKQERTMGMTASGMAVLFGCDDELAASRPADCRGVPPDKNIDPGLAWMDNHFDQALEPHYIGGSELHNYALYAIARLGLISGRRYFGNRDWYEDGARMLLASRDPATGVWSNLPDTCFGILFLARGRNPIIVSKLQYDIIGGLPPRRNAPRPPPGPPSGPPHPANWNLRPRDMAQLSDWIANQVEREYNWQTVNLQVPVEELHDSAVLYIAGDQPLNLTKEEKDKLKQFIVEGGLVVGNADCGNKDFADTFCRLGSELFPNYEFRNVPRDSVIFTGEQYRAAKWRVPPQVVELNNGVRDLMILIPLDDPARFFQLRQVGNRDFLYELMANILFYAVDQNGARLRGDTYIVRPDSSIHADRTIKVARLQYAGNWDPEPAGWTRLAAVMHNTRHTDLQVVPIRPGDGKLDQSFKVAHLTGTANFHLSEAARSEIKSFVDQGGTLIIDAAGGSSAFDTVAQSELKSIFPLGAMDVLPADHPVFQAGEKLGRVAYRRFAALRLGKADRFRIQSVDINPNEPVTNNSRTRVFYSAEDLSEGLVGQPIDGIYGYSPQTATSLMANLLTYAAGK